MAIVSRADLRILELWKNGMSVRESHDSELETTANRGFPKDYPEDL